MQSFARHAVFVPIIFIVTFGALFLTSWSVTAQMLQVTGDVRLQMSQVTPGSSLEKVLTVTNTAHTSQVVLVYLLDEEFLGVDGARFLQPGVSGRSVAPWVDISEQTFTLAPQESRELRILISVPSASQDKGVSFETLGEGESDEPGYLDDQLKGSYWSALMVEGVPARESVHDAQETAENALAVSFNVRFRQAFTISVTMADKGDAELHFSNPTIHYGPNGRSADQGHDVGDTASQHPVALKLWVANRSNTLTPPVSVAADLFDAQGDFVTRATSEARRLMPGQAREFDLGLGALAPGQYSAVVLADSGEGDIFGARYTLNVKAGVGE